MKSIEQTYIVTIRVKDKKSSAVVHVPLNIRRKKQHRRRFRWW